MGTDAYFRKKERRIASWPCESGLRYTRKLTEKPRPFWGVGRLITWPSGNILHVLSCTSEWTATGLCKCTCCLRSDSKHCSIWNLTLDVHMRERELFFLIHLLPSLAAVLSRPLMLNRKYSTPYLPMMHASLYSARHVMVRTLPSINGNLGRKNPTNGLPCSRNLTEALKGGVLADSLTIAVHSFNQSLFDCPAVEQYQVALWVRAVQAVQAVQAVLTHHVIL